MTTSPIPTPPEGIIFADPESEENYAKAMSGAPGPHHIKHPMIVISGPAASGKTRLAAHILKSRFGEAYITSLPRTEDEFEKLIPHAIEKKYLFLDNVAEFVKAHALSRAITSTDWSYRPLGKSEIKTLKVDLQVIVTSPAIIMSEDLCRRSIFIELA